MSVQQFSSLYSAFSQPGPFYERNDAEKGDGGGDGGSNVDYIDLGDSGVMSARAHAAHAAHAAHTAHRTGSIELKDGIQKVEEGKVEERKGTITAAITATNHNNQAFLDDNDNGNDDDTATYHDGHSDDDDASRDDVDFDVDSGDERERVAELHLIEERRKNVERACLERRRGHVTADAGDSSTVVMDCRGVLLHIGSGTPSCIACTVMYHHPVDRSIRTPGV